MNINDAIEQACKEPTLLAALSYIALWESERIVKQARENQQWDTCFRHSFEQLLDKYEAGRYKYLLTTDLTEKEKEYLRQLRELIDKYENQDALERYMIADKIRAITYGLNQESRPRSLEDYARFLNETYAGSNPAGDT